MNQCSFADFVNCTDLSYTEYPAFWQFLWSYFWHWNVLLKFKWRHILCSYVKSYLYIEYYEYSDI